MTQIQKDKVDTATTAYPKSARVAAGKLKCILLGEGNLNGYRQEILRGNPRWDMIIDFVVPSEKESFGKLTKFDRVYVFDDFPHKDNAIIKLVDKCKEDESTRESSICVVINDDNRKHGATDIDTKEETYGKTKEMFAKLVGDDNVFVYNQNGISDLFYWNYHAYDNVLWDVFNRDIATTKYRIENDLFSNDGLYDYLIELLRFDSEENYLVEFEKKYTSSDNDYTKSSTVCQTTNKLSESWFGNKHSIIAKEFASFYKNSCMGGVMYWDADKDTERLCSEVKERFISFMTKQKYEKSENYGDSLNQFLKSEMKSVICKYCLKRLSKLEGLLHE
jgi:hypothetical protein